MNVTVGDATPRWCIALFIPEVESVLVHNDAVVQRLFGRSLDEVEQALREVAPRKALERLLRASAQDWSEVIAHLREDRELAVMVAQAPGLQEIMEFARRTTAHAAA